jgi:N-acetyl sugar amidotransferase
MKDKFQLCSTCVMDTSDINIKFDLCGVCDHCHSFKNDVLPTWHPNEKGEAFLQVLIDKIKFEGRDKPFNCIMGLSGGADSSYMLHLVVSEFGLRPLVFHVDGGWNTDGAVHNIQVMVDKLGLDLFTEVINWDEMRDLQLAFFKSGVPHLDVPQDHVNISTLYHFANKYNIKYIFNGGNYSTECVRNPLDWLYYGTDMAQINDIHKRYGTIPLKTFPLSSILFHKMYLRYLRGVQVIKPLNFLPYIKSDAVKILSDKYNWKSFSQKHFESRFTRFFEGYWLPTRFGFDTRKVQLSSLILTGQLSREDALDILKSPAYDILTIDEDFAYIATKLRISVDELRSYHDMPLRSFKDYKNNNWMFNIGAKVLQTLRLEGSIKR